MQLHQKYGKDGVVCLSVSVDQPEKREKALEFLKKQNAAFPNYWLDAKEALWQEKWDLNAPPAIFVFDRQGRRAGKFDNSDADKPFEHEDVEKLVRRLLQPDP